MIPAVGRIVHYKHPTYGTTLAAIITKVEIDSRARAAQIENDYEVWINVFMPDQTHTFPRGPTKFGEGDGEWSWPPRVS